MFYSKKPEKTEAPQMRHARASDAWSELKLSLEGFRAPTMPEVRRGADELKSALVAEVFENERALEAARDDVVKAALECASFQLNHGEAADDHGLAPIIASARRLTNSLKENTHD